jgi:hypothetical protein
MSNQYVDFMTQNPLFYKMVRENMAKAWAESQATGRIEDGIEHAHGQILKLLQCRFSGTLLGLAKQRLSDIRDVEVLNALLEAVLIGDDPQLVRTLLEEHSPPRHGGRIELFTESILSAVHSYYSDLQLEFIKQLVRIQDVTVLEKIEQAALVSDIQGVWSLVRAHKPAK